jgi:acyl-CoA thioesterase-1
MLINLKEIRERTVAMINSIQAARLKPASSDGARRDRVQGNGVNRPGWLATARRRLPGWRPLLAMLFLAHAASAHSAPKTLLVLGDSLSAEYGLDRGAGWVSLFEQRLKTEKVDATVVNASISGETTSGGRMRLPTLLAKRRPDIVVVELGANDALRGLPLSATEANLRAICAESVKAGSRVLLIGMRIPPNYGRDYADRFHAVYGKVASDCKSPLVPFMLEGIAEKPQLFQADRMHPLAAAHPIILNNILPQLLPMIKSR